MALELPPVAAEKVPAAQDWQVALELAPEDAEKVPATHAEQTLAPVAEKVPALQALQAPPITTRVEVVSPVYPPVGSNTAGDSACAHAPPRHQVLSLLPIRTVIDVSCRVQYRAKAIPAGPPEFPAENRIVLNPALRFAVNCAGVHQVQLSGIFPACTLLTKTVQ